MEIEINFYETLFGDCPFDDWFEKISDSCTRAKILIRLDRLKLGNFGDCHSVGDGISELRIHYGPGIRLYFSTIGNKVILLLCGGTKKTQNKDIIKAKVYYKDYYARENK